MLRRTKRSSRRCRRCIVDLSQGGQECQPSCKPICVIKNFLEPSKPMSYVPHTEAERAEMLKVVGAKSLEDLFSHLPAEFRIGEMKSLPPGLGEMELAAELRKLANKNRSNVDLACFLGAG